MSHKEKDLRLNEYSNSIRDTMDSPKSIYTCVTVDDKCSSKSRQRFILFMFVKFSDSLLLFTATILSIVNSLVPVAVTILLGQLFEKLSKLLIGEYNSSAEFINDLKLAAFSISLVGIGSFLFNWISVSSFMQFGERQQIRCRRMIFPALLKKEFGWFDKNTELNGALIQVNRCVEEFRGSVSECLCLFLTNTFTILALLVTSFIYSWRLTLVAISGFPIIAIVGVFVGQLIERFTVLENDLTALAAKTIDWNLTSYQWIKLVNGQTIEEKKFRSQVHDCASAFTKLKLFTCLNLGIIKTLSLMMFVQSFWFGSFLIKRGLNKPADIVSCFYACLTSAMLFNGIAENIVLLQKGNIALNKILEFIGCDEKSVENNHTKKSPVPREHIRGEIKLENINFSYPFRLDVPVLKDVDITIPANRTTYIVGKSGSGKSTLSNLLLRFYSFDDITNGRRSRITLDGFDIHDFSSSFLTDAITLVQQSSSIFSGTLKENIEFGVAISDTLSTNLLSEATKMSQLDGVISSFPEGLNTGLGTDYEGSVKLSGGQQQRVALARARVKDAPILILDEFTSALDAFTKDKVLEGVRQWRKDKTTIILTHEFSHIGNEDLVYVMQNGMIVEHGLKKDLLKIKNGHFATLNTHEHTGNNNIDNPFLDDGGVEEEDINSDIISLFTFGKDAYLEENSKIENQDTMVGRFSTFISGASKMPKSKVVVTDVENQVGVSSLEENKTVSSDLMGVWKLVYYYRDHIKKHLMLLIMGLFISGLNAACNPLFSYCFAKLINGIVPSSTSSSEILKWSLTVTGIAVFDGISLFLSKFIMGYISERLICSIRKAAFENILKQNMHWFTHCQSAELAALLLNDARDLRHIVSEFLVIIVNVLVMVIFGTVWSIICGWKLALVGLSFVPLFVFVGILYSSLLEKSEDKYKASVSGIENQVYECLSGIKTVLCLNLKGHFLQKFQDRLSSCQKVGLSRAIIVGFGVSLPNILMYLAESVLLFYGFKLIGQGHYTTVQVMEVFSLMLFSMSNSLSLLTSCPDITKGQRAGTYLARILETINFDSEFRGYAKPPFNLHKGDCLIKMDNVSYCYSSDAKGESQKQKHVLNNVNFEIMQGETVAIVGESGSGKSTLISLLLRLYNFEGSKTSSIELLGYSISDLKVQFIRDHIAIVPQTAIFFEGTVLENLTYSLPVRLQLIPEEDTLQRVWDILDMVDLKDFFKCLPDQLNSKVGDVNNTLFSGGQAQRLSIARALMRDPRIIIFDECTSALDPENSKRIRDFINQELGPKDDITVLMVTHSKEMMKIADKIVCLGTECEVGTFEELLDKSESFTKLLTSC